MNLFDSVSGETIKKKIVKRSENNLYLVFPEFNGILSFYGILYAESYMREIGAERVVLVTADKLIKDSAEKMLKGKYRIFLLNSKKMSRLLTNLALHSDLMGHSIVKNLFYISVTYPYGKGFKVLSDGKIFDEKYIVWNRIFHRENIYYAEDPQIKDDFADICKVFMQASKNIR